jgi:S-adenosylmethionine:tRNA ribosyltransferase-isomerase
MRTDLFDFDLPDEAIALEPVSPRDAARLLVVRPAVHAPTSSPRRRGPMQASGADTESYVDYSPLRGNDVEFDDRLVRDLPDLLRPGDALVFNDTRVIRAALQGERWRGENSAHVSFNLHKRIDESRWRAFARPAKRLGVGDRIRFGHDGRVCLLGTLDATVSEVGEAGEVELSFSLHGAYLDEAIGALGDPPLPPYIVGKRAVRPEDAETYQTVYARHEGAVAAPTAGLHFTADLLRRLEGAGIEHCFVTLHVGLDTFRPVTAERLADHQMHSEWGRIDAAAVERIRECRNRGGRVIAVGTTSVRVLESAAADRAIEPWNGWTKLFIRPPYTFRAVDVLLTNFHLPRTTLLVLVHAFGGDELIRRAYEEAIRNEYRFYSYGDAMLVL